MEAVVDGDQPGLEAMLRGDPGLARARSERVTHFDPPVHRATLLHYVAANGVESHRQRTPANAAAIATALLDAGADADATASLYGGECTVMSMLVSSCHPANAGVQCALIDLLVDRGAAVESRGEGRWTSPLMAALAFSYLDAARTLVRRGARVDHVAAAAGLNLVGQMRRLLPESDADSRHRALALAGQMGHTEAARLLLDTGEDPDRYNPAGLHAHATPLHHAALAGHLETVRLLAERGARLDIRDKLWDATPLGWAIHGGRNDVEAWLRSRG